MATMTALGSLRNPASFRTIEQKLAMGIWPWTDGVRSRLPLHYKLRYIEKHQCDPKPVHYKPDPAKHKLNSVGHRVDVQNTPVPVIYPAQANEGLWGGEGFLLGLKKKHDKHRKPRVYQLWKPNLQKRAVFCEILDQWLEVTVTLRTLDLIDEAHGFDHYILGTHEIDLQSKLGMQLKRKLLLTLLNRSMFPTNPSKQDEVYEKYKKYLIPEEEVEWLGLSMEEAERKQEALDEEKYQASIRPMKEAYMADLVEKMRSNQLDEETEATEGSGKWMDKLNPFKSH